MAPQFVKPYVKTNKHDAADAEAFVKPSPPNMRFVPVKPLSSKPYWHFTGVVRASSNSEPHKPIKSGGYWPNLALFPRGIQQLQRRLPELVEDADNPLPVLFRTQLSLLQHHMAYLFDVIATLDKQIEQCYRQNVSASVSARSLVLALLPPAR
jgi:hypothetical protein